MLKKFNNFVNEIVKIDGKISRSGNLHCSRCFAPYDSNDNPNCDCKKKMEIKVLNEDPAKVTTVDVRQLYSVFKLNEALICNELNRKLRGREIKIMEMAYDEKRNMFKWVPINSKFKRFNSAEKIEDKYFIIFDEDCMLELSQGLMIENRLIIFDI